ncbi:MAG TPA: tetratricopeptide repeat protein, partial [bacterium]|nr:tetratricopeptide repeat protein [bacterium]
YFTSLVAQPKDAGVSFVFAKKLYQDGLFDIAAEQFHQFAENNSEHPQASEALLMAGNCYYQLGNYREAVKEFSLLISRYPDAKILDEAHFRLAESFKKNNQTEAAAKSYRQVQIFYPKSPLAAKSLLLSAKLYFQLGDYESAKAVVYQILELYPTGTEYFEARLLLSQIHQKADNPKLAKFELEKVLTATQQGVINATALVYAARLEANAKRYQFAEEHYLALINQYHNTNIDKIKSLLDSAYVEIADIYSRKGWHEKANNYLMKITNFDHSTNLILTISENLMQQQQYTEALKKLQQIVSIETDSAVLIKTNYFVGICYAELKDFSASNQFLGDAISLIRSFSLKSQFKDFLINSYHRLSQNFLHLNQPELAIKYLKTLSAEFPDLKRADFIVFKIANIYENQLEDYDLAIRFHFQILERFSRSRLVDDAIFGIGRCYEQKKEFKQAVSAYNRLLNSYPASDFSLQVLNRIQHIKNYHVFNSEIIDNIGAILKSLFAESELNPAMRIGLFYLNNLKDYKSAIDYLSQALTQNSLLENEREKIIFALARSHHLLAFNEDTESNEKTSLIKKAHDYYSMIIENFQSSSLVGDATFHKIEMLRNQFDDEPDSESYRSLIKSMEEFKDKFPRSQYLDTVLLWLAKLKLSTNHFSTAKDSLDIANSLMTVIANHEGGELRYQAEYLYAVFLHGTGNDSLLIERMTNFITRYNNAYQIGKAHLLLAQTLMRNQKFVLAGKYYLKIANEYYYSSVADSAEIILGGLLAKQNKITEALDYYYKLHQDNELSGLWNFQDYKYEDVLFNIANLNQKNNDHSKSIQFYKQYLNTFPKGKYRDKCFFHLANLFLLPEGGRDPDQAINYFQALLTTSSQNPFSDSALIRLADVYFDEDEYEMALKYYEKAEKKNNQDSWEDEYPSFKKIICLIKLGKVARAEKDLNEFRKKYKDNKSLIAQMQLELGDNYLNNKIFDRAERIFKDVRSSFKNSYESERAEYLLGKLYFILNKDNEALDITTKLIQKEPSQDILADAYMILGNFYYLQTKQIEHAMIAYKKVTELQRLKSDVLKNAMNNLIKCYTDLRLREQALVTIRNYIEKFPTAEDIFEKKILMAMQFYELNEYDRALDLLRKLKYEADVENEPRIQFWIGECYLGMGQFKKAVSEYLKVVYLSQPSKFSWKVTAQFQAGIAYLKANEHQRAKELFERIVREYGAGSVFGKSAQKKVDEIDLILTNKSMEI